MLFWKMNGIGNDYIFVDYEKLNEKEIAALNSNLKNIIIGTCDRHFGVGADGVVLMLPSTVADVRMRMFNADGSEGKMCGNAVRCIAKYLFDTGKRRAELLTIETLAGIVNIGVTAENDRFVCARVDMGRPRITRADNVKIYVDIGNPHVVIFSTALDDEEMRRAATISVSEDVNVELVKPLSANVAQMRVYERGSGETLACGTGASAVAYALIARNMASSPVTIIMRGGELTTEYVDGHIYMIGKADLNYIGEINIFDYGQD